MGTIRLGTRGEGLAVKHLKNKGYRIIKRNFKTPSGEIDIIAQDGDTLVFVEVKARTGESFGRPEEAVGPRKQKKIRTIAQQYLFSQKKERAARFDIVSVLIRDGREEVRHLIDAFEDEP